MAKFLIFIISYVFFQLFQICFARVGFVKDQSLYSVQFPPVIATSKDSFASIPTGHLRPLGWQRRPDGKVAEEAEIIHPKEFFEKYVNTSTPVVFRGAIKDVIAMTRWKKDEYLKTQYGKLNVHVVVKKEVQKMGPKVMSFKSFLKEYNFDDWYLTNIIPQEMMQELVLPKCLKCGMTAFLQESGIWMSSGGTASLLHSHADHNLHCVLTGKKDFILIQPKYKDKLYYHNKEPHKGDGYSEMDMDMINMFKYPKVAEVQWTWSTLLPGDCMFVPSTHLHQVRSYGRSFSSTILWAPSPELNFDDCPENEAELDRVVSLNEAPFIWTYLKADRELSNLRLNAASLKHHLKVWMRHEEGLRFDVMKDYYDEIMSELSAADKPSMTEIWHTLGGSTGKKVLSRDQVNKLKDAALTKVANFLNKPHELHGHEAPKKEQKHDEL